MSARVAKLRWSLLVGILAVMAAGRAYAQTTPCNVDTDCPGTACGTQVCAHDSGGIRCVDPGALGTPGISDGWCADSNGAMQDSNCKCRSLGATCAGFYCTMTTAPATGTAGTSGGTAGTTGTAGTGSGTGGSTGSAGTSGGGGGGGCSVGGAPSVGCSLGAALLAAALMRRRGRRRV